MPRDKPRATESRAAKVTEARAAAARMALHGTPLFGCAALKVVDEGKHGDDDKDFDYDGNMFCIEDLHQDAPDIADDDDDDPYGLDDDLDDMDAY